MCARGAHWTSHRRANATAATTGGRSSWERAGEIQNFTGITSPYEVPENPEIRIDTTKMSPAEASAHILNWLEGKGMMLGFRAPEDDTPTA